MLGVRSRCLQNGQVQLQAVVGGQRGLDPVGYQQGARPHGGDSVGLLHQGPFQFEDAIESEQRT